MARVGTRKHASRADAGIEAIGPSRYLKKAVTNVDFEDGESLALWVGTAGTATITQTDANVLTDFPLHVGKNEISAIKVVFGTAADIWAMY